MRKDKLVPLVILIFLLALTLSGCGPTNQTPNASFSANPTSGNVPLEVTFDASNSSDSDGSIISYEWDFDDGSTSSKETVTHTYDSAGNYTVELSITDNDGATDSTSQSIDVSPPPSDPPTASFTASPTSGEAPLEVSFSASGSNDPDGNINTYNWDFGDGSTGSGENITHTYGSSGNYTVQLTVEDNDGVTDSMTMNISVSAPSNESPNASFSANPTSGEVPLDVSFDASNASDPDGSIESYSWDFDDGSTGSGVNVANTFDSSGTYNVELTVTDNEGATDSTSKAVSVSTPTNDPPKASFTANPTSGEAPLEVSFDASDSNDSDGTITSYSWDFGDETTGSGETVKNTFELTGSYTVELTVTDNKGATDVKNKIISVSGKKVEILDWELVEGSVMNAVIEGSLKNISNQKIDTCTVSADFYGSNGEKLGTYSNFVHDVEPGATTTFELMTGLDYDKVKEVKNLEAEVHF